MMLNETQLEIFSRQIMLPELGVKGQEKLLSSAVLVCGVGGLGSPAAVYLAAMGIGRIGLVDGDVIALSNLNRQWLYSPAEVGRLKVEVAAERLRHFHPDVTIISYAEMINESNAAQLIDGYDIMIDGLDNISARLSLNDACIKGEKPFIHGGISRFFGQIMTVVPGKSPCLRCLLSDEGSKVEQKKKTGIIGAAAGVVGALQAIEAAGLQDKVKVIGYNGDKEALENVKSGRLVATMKSQPVEIGKAIID
jgi:molybdopterin/thiamine biosynthesis adenylyltransferase